MHRREFIHFLKQKRHIIWDWNGTLLNDVDVCVEIITSIMTKYRLQPVSKADYRKVFGFPVAHYYKKLGFDLEKVSFAELTKDFIGAYTQKSRQCQLFQGCIDLLHELKEAHINHSVLSAANEIHLHDILNHFGIQHYFQHIFGLSDDYAQSKIERGKELLAQLDCAPEDIALVGDTDHDLEVGRTLGIDVALVGDGHQCPTRLEPIHHHVFNTRYHNSVRLGVE